MSILRRNRCECEKDENEAGRSHDENRLDYSHVEADPGAKQIINMLLMKKK